MQINSQKGNLIIQIYGVELMGRKGIRIVNDWKGFTEKEVLIDRKSQGGIDS